MASTLPETPSSLKEQCLQYLIDHLEYIPVEALALLPTAIRRTLAVHLPVADILQLERTRFASGLDMPGVWKEVCDIRHLLSRYPKLVEMFENDKIEAMEFVMMVVTYEALHPQQEKPHFQTVPHTFKAKRVHRLQDHVSSATPPSTPGPPHVHAPDPPVFFSRICFESSFRVPQCAVPSRFVTMQQEMAKCAVPPRFFTMHRNSIDGGVLQLLSTRYHINPERLYIDCSSCVGGTNMMMKVLPQLKQLSINCKKMYRRVHSLLSGCSQCLHTLTLDDCPDEAIEGVVSTIASVFTDSPANLRSLRHFSVAVYRASQHRRYGCGTGCVRAVRSITHQLQKALITLCKVIQTHTSLHSCSFRQWTLIRNYRLGQLRGSNDSNFLGSVLSLFEQPQFQCLSLAETSLSLEDIQHLVHTFLTTPCDGPQTLKLECIHVRIISYATDHTAPLIHDKSYLCHKSLVLFLIPSSNHTVKASLKEWFSSICKLQLHSLTVLNTDY